MFNIYKKLKKSKKFNVFLLYELFNANFFPGKSCRKSVRCQFGLEDADLLRLLDLFDDTEDDGGPGGEVAD